MHRFFFLSILLAGCNSSATSDDLSTTDTTPTDTTPEVDTGDTEPEPEPEASTEDWEDDWVGTVVIDAFGDDFFDGCSGDIELDFDDDGEVDGDGNCDYGSTLYDLEFEGEVDADGVLTGVLIIDFSYAPDTEVTVEGAAEDEDNIEAKFEGTYIYESWGTDYEYDLTGSITVSREE